MITYNRNLKKLASYFRKNLTTCENILWQRIRRKQINNVQFYRQRIIGNFIVDFCCFKPKKLIIEIDGDNHYKKENFEKDKNREIKLRKMGFEIIRFTNGEIYQHIDKVLEKIYETLTKSPLTPL